MFINHLIKLLILIVVCGIAIESFGGDWLMSFYLKEKLGTEVTFESLDIDFANTQMEIHNLTVANPTPFPEGSTMIIPSVFMDVDLKGLLQWEIWLKTLDIKVQEIRVLDTIENGLNLNGLQMLNSQEASEHAGWLPKLKVQSLVLSLGEATYTDLTNDHPMQKAYDLEVTETIFEDLAGFQEIGKAVVLVVLKEMGLLEVPK